MLLAIIAMIAALQSAPQQWVFVGGDDSTGFAIEKGSLRRSGSVVTAWVMAIPNQPVANQYVDMADYVLTQTRYDCAELTLKDVGRFVYRTDGSLANSTTAIPDPPVAPPPGSTGSSIISLLCTLGALDSFDSFATPQAIRDAFRAQYGSR